MLAARPVTVGAGNGKRQMTKSEAAIKIESHDALVVCDVCHTLFEVNTTAGFVRYAMRQTDPLRYGLARLLQSRRTPLLYALLVGGKLLGQDLGRDAQLRLLKGYYRDALSQLAGRWLDEELGRLRRDAIYQPVKTPAGEGAPIILASASIDPVVEAIAGRLGADFVCSRLEYDERGVCTGRLATDMTGAKDVALSNAIADAGQVVVITDNESDASLLRRADQRIVVKRHSSQDMSAWRERLAGVEYEVV